MHFFNKLTSSSIEEHSAPKKLAETVHRHHLKWAHWPHVWLYLAELTDVLPPATNNGNWICLYVCGSISSVYMWVSKYLGMVHCYPWGCSSFEAALSKSFFNHCKYPVHCNFGNFHKGFSLSVVKQEVKRIGMTWLYSIIILKYH